MARLKIVETLPRYHALVSPTASGRRARAVVIDERTTTEVEAESIALYRGSWADVVIAGCRLRIPVKRSLLPRKGGMLLGAR